MLGIVGILHQMDEQALEELAVQEILKDLKRGAERAKEHGALGWQKNPAPPPNKRFLRNMLVSTLRDNRPFKRRHKFHNTHGHNSSHHETTSRTTNESETYFRYSDRYRQKKDGPDNESDQGKDSCSSSPGHGGNSFSLSHPESAECGKRQRESRPLRTDKSTDITNSSIKSQYHKKRSRTSISDSDVEERNGEVKNKKKQKRKHHKKTYMKDGGHSHEKRKHKKSKKSKKHESKRSCHSSKHKS